MDEKSGSEHVLNSEAEKRPNLKTRTRRVCARFWWLFLLIFAIVVLIIVLPIVYVAYPKIARSAADESTLDVTAMAITDPAPHHVTLSFEQVFYTNSSYRPTIYPFNASFYLPDSDIPFASVETPQLQGGNGTASVVPPQTVNITHPTQFTEYVLLALESKEFTIALKGTGGLKQGSLPETTVDWNKNITLKGFDGLSGFSLESFHVRNASEPDGTNAYGTAIIPNPTIMTIELGNVTLAMSVNGTSVGTTYIQDLTLKPGNNTVNMRTTVYELVVVGLIFNGYSSGILPVNLVGNTSTYNGVELPYYNAMLEATKLKLDLNVFDAIKGTNLTSSKMAKMARSQNLV